MQNGLFIGEAVFIAGIFLWVYLSPAAGLPVCIIGAIFLSISLRYVIKARLLLHSMEKSGEADALYREIELKSCILSPQTNTIMSANYVISSGGKTGFEIIRNSDVIRFWQNDYKNNKGYTRDIILITKEGKKHYIAFYNSKTPIPGAYQEIVELLKKRLTRAVFGKPE
jgi:hypothetical protein